MCPTVGRVPAAAALFCAILAALAVFQVALIAGAPLGHLAWGGQDRVLPRTKRAGSVVSVVLYAAFALLAVGAGRQKIIGRSASSSSGRAMSTTTGT